MLVCTFYVKSWRRENDYKASNSVSIASKFDSFFYLLENPDVLSAINDNDFKDAFSHFEAFGHKESRQPNQLFNTA